MTPTPTRAFTLVELLVVITIIIVLLALLAPAMDRAIYQAELAVCGANEGGMAKGIWAYAMQYKRTYPYRPSVEIGGEGQVNKIRNGTGFAGESRTVQDDRPILRPFISIKMFQDPLTRRVNYETQDPSLWIYSSYWLWWRIGYTGDPAMKRLGDRVTWMGPDHENKVQTWSFAYLISEDDFTNQSNGVVHCSHPDDSGFLMSRASDGGATFLTLRGIQSLWVNDQSEARGSIDVNLTRADGSVRRLDMVELHDERTIEVPEFTNARMHPQQSGHIARD